MAEQIPLYPVRSAAAVAAANRKRAAYLSAAGPGPGADRPSRYQLEDESAHLDEMPLMMSEEGFENDESDYHTLPRARITRRKRGLEWFVCGGWKFLCTSCCDWLINICQRKRELKARTVWLGCPEKCEEKHPRNSIKNQKYNIFTFIPGVLYEQFKFFLNLYFLIVSCSQFVPALKIGYLYTYWAPLGFVLAVTIMREAVDEFRRFQRDKEVNSQLYSKLTVRGKVQVKSSDIQVGDLIIVEKNQRIPSDMVFLRTSEKAGSCFIRTDQLDGETDWKLKVAVSCTQRLPALGDLFSISAYVYAQKPQLDIHSFEGTFTRVGLLDLELNQLTKALFLALVALSVVMVTLQGFAGPWYRSLFRFLLLFSYIIPISLRVNLDMGKAAYGWMIMKDENIPGTVVRTSTIPEELGRLVYLLTDKTGTLTQNEMVFKRLHLGTVSYGTDTMDEIQNHLMNAYAQTQCQAGGSSTASTPPRKAQSSAPKVRRSVSSRVHEAVKAVALCHNVTPVYEARGMAGETEVAEADQDFSDDNRTYQASSPDESASLLSHPLVYVASPAGPAGTCPVAQPLPSVSLSACLPSNSARPLESRVPPETHVTHGHGGRGAWAEEAGNGVWALTSSRERLSEAQSLHTYTLVSSVSSAAVEAETKPMSPTGATNSAQGQRLRRQVVTSNEQAQRDVNPRPRSFWLKMIDSMLPTVPWMRFSSSSHLNTYFSHLHFNYFDLHIIFNNHIVRNVGAAAAPAPPPAPLLCEATPPAPPHTPAPAALLLRRPREKRRTAAVPEKRRSKTLSLFSIDNVIFTKVVYYAMHIQESLLFVYASTQTGLHVFSPVFSITLSFPLFNHLEEETVSPWFRRGCVGTWSFTFSLCLYWAAGSNFSSTMTHFVTFTRLWTLEWPGPALPPGSVSVSSLALA
ncbi:hypothetical protein FD754_002075 [Muntiacus muntjak]|uniref:P-type ATPase N-terminal domain-containing protein n=1 Tax=Muntiacus muntjak TaxID=9888 RepID=A0A5N3W883_MUNMU|nr:hypothetical protein FD754_002075 [Muntiacus muntjak]